MFVIAWLFMINQTANDPRVAVREEKPLEWVIAYYMSYDNNLGSLGEHILAEIAAGVTDPGIAVVVQADLPGQAGMTRISFQSDGNRLQEDRTTIPAQNSADEAELAAFLAWVKESWPAKNVALVFLNHGGKLNQMCLDDHPNHPNKYEPAWLQAHLAGPVCADFNASINGRVRLLFLQQCGRASLENLYNFTGAAEYLLASPFIVGAPNTYYKPLLSWLGRSPNVSGVDVAARIMAKDKHYVLYTLVQNQELARLPAQLERLFGRSGRFRLNGKPERVFPIRDETNVDLLSFLKLLASRDPSFGKRKQHFSNWVQDRLIVKTSLGPRPSRLHRRSCGLSLFLPRPGQAERYRFLPLYAKSPLAEVMNALSPKGLEPSITKK